MDQQRKSLGDKKKKDSEEIYRDITHRKEIVVSPSFFSAQSYMVCIILFKGSKKPNRGYFHLEFEGIRSEDSEVHTW